MHNFQMKNVDRIIAGPSKLGKIIFKTPVRQDKEKSSHQSRDNNNDKTNRMKKRKDTGTVRREDIESVQRQATDSVKRHATTDSVKRQVTSVSVKRQATDSVEKQDNDSGKRQDTDSVMRQDTDSVKRQDTASSAKPKRTVSSKKNKKAGSADYYRGLENFLLKPDNKQIKLQFWSKNTSAVCSSDSNRDDDLSEQNNQLHNMDKSLNGEHDLAGSIRESPVMSCSLDVSVCIQPSVKEKSLRIKAIVPLQPRRSRMKCGMKSCVPCSYDKDCGRCLQCLNKKTKK